MKIFINICKILILFLYAAMLIRTHKERERLDKDDPNSPMTAHLLDIEVWLAALIAVISIG